ncbi:Vinorine synthase, partial [Cucurbita argyrosperma subsp. argyrosperma]
MELEILCKETIKPITSTSPELRNLPLCLFDQQAPNIYMQLLYFYTKNNAAVSSSGCHLTSLTNFMNDWASIARSSDDSDLPVVSPEINGVRYFPPELGTGGDLSGGEDSGTVRRDENVRSKRLVFEGSKIAALKAMVSEEVKNPTRVQILAAFIYKAVLSAKYSATGGLSLVSIVFKLDSISI